MTKYILKRGGQDFLNSFDHEDSGTISWCVKVTEDRDGKIDVDAAIGIADCYRKINLAFGAFYTDRERQVAALDQRIVKIEILEKNIKEMKAALKAARRIAIRKHKSEATNAD